MTCLFYCSSAAVFAKRETKEFHPASRMMLSQDATQYVCFLLLKEKNKSNVFNTHYANSAKIKKYLLLLLLANKNKHLLQKVNREAGDSAY